MAEQTSMEVFLEYDVVIVGSGAGGGTVAKELSVLCQTGVTIALLELGPRFKREDNIREELPMARKYYFSNGGFQTTSQDMTLAFAKGVGGSTNVYTGVTFKVPDSALKKWNVPGITLNDLDPRMDKYIEENHVHYERESNINRNNQLFKKGCETLGWHVGQFPINTQHCIGLNTCNLGCPRQAKQGTAIVQIPMAERNGVQVIPNCRVDRIEGHEIIATLTESLAMPNGKTLPYGRYRIKAKKIVLSAGSVNTPAILMRSFGKKFNPVIGRYLTCHPALIIAAEHADVVDGMQGPPKNYYSDQFVDSDRFLLESCMYFPFSFAKNLVGFGTDVDDLVHQYPYLQMALILAIDEAHQHNRIDINSHGEPVVYYRLDQRLKQTFVKALRACAQLVFASGAIRAHLPGTENFFITPDDLPQLDQLISEKNFKLGQMAINSAHLMGGCRMGTSAKTSVTNEWGKIHGYDYLYVADGSLFPRCSEVNPYLTIMALADRVAEGIRNEVAV